MRCFTVLLACGWLLLMAPKNPNEGWTGLDLTRPLKEWDQLQFFDSAKECYASASIDIADILMRRRADAINKYQREGLTDNEALDKALELQPTYVALVQGYYKITRCVPLDLITFPLK